MTYKSKLGWPEQPDNLTTYQGGRPGRNQVRKAEMEAQGMKGIRRVDWKDAQGNSYTMNTRNGFPEVIKSTDGNDGQTGTISAVRGFVAHVPDAVKAALFSPYTLVVSDPNYRIYEHIYTVLPFETPYNVPLSDTTDWFDVIAFYRGRILINGLEMKNLQITSPPVTALPWLIPHAGTGEGKYGDRATNSYEKRVFAIYRESVHSWMGGTLSNPGTTVSLLNPSARPYKTMMGGASIVPADNKAFLAQMAFTGSYWDALLGGWAFTAAEVSMMLTPPYLTKVDIGVSAERSLCIPTSTGAPVAGTEETATTIPPCQVGLTCSAGTPIENTPFDYVRFYMDGARVETPTAFEHNTFSRAEYEGSLTESVALGQVSADVTATNTYSNSTINSFIGVHEQFEYTGSSTGNGGATVVDLSNLLLAPTGLWGAVFWGLQEDYFNDPPYYTPGDNSADWVSRQSAGDFNVSVGGDVLVGGSFSRHIASGEQAKLTMHDWADYYLTPYGAYGDLVTYGPSYSISGSYAEGSPDYLTCVDRMHAAVAAWGTTPAFTNRNAGLGFGNFGDRAYKKYDVSLGVRDFIDDSQLNWSTKDFILYDAANSCFISVDSVFSGAQAYGGSGVAALTVNLTISTPSGTDVQTLFTTSLTYAELLPEQTLEYSLTYVPNPQQRVMFVPLFKEQGDFKGAAYTTSAEVSAGAVPAYLFNFVLKLDTYYAIGEDTSSYPTINFIPCNLLEMLYAYVYSSKYGVDPYERYPVSNATNYSALQATLFGTQYAVSYRDGDLVDWLDTLGSSYSSETEMELFRV